VATAYILYSPDLTIYYIGSCLDFETRLKDHRDGKFANSFTRRSDDWQPFLLFENLEKETERSIESHIKRMKSKKYLVNLKKYPEMREKLLSQYQVENSKSIND
jgi:putative endonuclease